MAQSLRGRPGLLEPHFARRLAEAVGTTREELTEWFATEPNAHWEDLTRRLDLPLVAVREQHGIPRPATAPPTEGHR